MTTLEPGPIRRDDGDAQVAEKLQMQTYPLARTAGDTSAPGGPPAGPNNVQASIPAPSQLDSPSAFARSDRYRLATPYSRAL